MIRNTPRSATTNNSLYKDIPKESQISQKTLDIVKSITLAKPLGDKTQQQSANQRITQQTNYSAFTHMRVNFLFSNCGSYRHFEDAYF